MVRFCLREGNKFFFSLWIDDLLSVIVELLDAFVRTQTNQMHLKNIPHLNTHGYRILNLLTKCRYWEICVLSFVILACVVDDGPGFSSTRDHFSNVVVVAVPVRAHEITG